MSSARELIFILLVRVVCPSNGNAFLKKSFPHELSYLDQTMIEERLLGEVRGFLGTGHGDLELPTITEALRPMWLALPKTEHGKLGNAQVRYALHRYFVQRHGWHIDGIADSGKHSFDGDASVHGILKERVPAFIMAQFEEAFGSTGLLLSELAIFAATIEHIIHDEATDRLNDVYEVLSRSRDDRLDGEEVSMAMDAFVLSLLGGKKMLKPPGTFQAKLRRLQQRYPGWADTRLWLDDMIRTVAYARRDVTNPFVPDKRFNFRQMEYLVERISEQFGPFQDMECKLLKDRLLEVEDGNTGRVRLSDFYRTALDQNEHFKEKSEHLRELGALDESRPGEARVIVTNYILSPGNCLANTGFYSICCINECEGVLGRLESMIASPLATPQRILDVVTNISTSSVASGLLSDWLVKRLGEVAARNGGKVPLHGRLFAQWLHLVFPRECPYPHAATADISPLSASEWLAQRKEKRTLQAEQMQEYIDNTSHAGGSEEADESQSEHNVEEKTLAATWSEEEEILYKPAETRRIVASSSSWAGSIGRAVVTLLVFGLAAAAAVDAARRFWPAAAEKGSCFAPQKAHLV